MKPIGQPAMPCSLPDNETWLSFLSSIWCHSKVCCCVEFQVQVIKQGSRASIKSDQVNL
ncbi:hypothetical protein B0F90DRAFT_1794734, partial [Multifurca ochricompacta]